jgi:lycopene beta-cyclase
MEPCDSKHRDNRKTTPCRSEHRYTKTEGPERIGVTLSAVEGSPKDSGPYDFIIAGGGLAGLSLAMQLVSSALRDCSILIIDKDTKQRNDRTWGFWSDRATLFDDAVYRTWRKLRVAGEMGDQRVDLGDYQYKMIRGIDFYNFAHQKLAAYPNVRILHGVVEAITDGKRAATVTVDGREFRGKWVFDSLPPRFIHDVDATDFHYLKMHFRGWEVETPEPRFDPECVTFLDFRTPQEREMRFFYVLPFAENCALVEFTLFSKRVLRHSEYEEALKDYLTHTLGIHEYRVLSEERGCVPITDQPLPRQMGRHIMSIGMKANRVKPSTGYAFMRIQEDSEEIVDSLLLYGHPFRVPDDPDLYDVLDAVMLEVMQRHGDFLKTAFGMMFKRVPVKHILRFLDEEATPWENLMLVASLPPRLFAQALLQVLTHQQLSEIIKS